MEDDLDELFRNAAEFGTIEDLLEEIEGNDDQMKCREAALVAWHQVSNMTLGVVTQCYHRLRQFETYETHKEQLLTLQNEIKALSFDNAESLMVTLGTRLKEQNNLWVTTKIKTAELTNRGIKARKSMKDADQRANYAANREGGI